MAHLAFFLPNMEIGGAEKVVLAQAIEFTRRGHQVDLILASAKGPLLDLLPPSIKVIDLKARRFRDALFPLTRYIRIFRPDAIQAVMWPMTVIAVIAKLFSGTSVRLIVADHTNLRIALPAGKALIIAKYAIRALYPWADARVIVSTDAQNAISRLSGLSVDQFIVIANPIMQTEVSARSIDHSGLWRGCGPKLLTVGSLKAVKNQKLLIEAFSFLPADLDASLVIAGEGEERGALEAQIAEANLVERIALPGAIIDPTPLYGLADMFILSSDLEGWPMVINEALWAGLPVVSTDCGDVAQILAPLGDDLVVPCGDAKALAKAIIARLSLPRSADNSSRRAEELTSKSLDGYEQLMIHGHLIS